MDGVDGAVDGGEGKGDGKRYDWLAESGWSTFHWLATV